MLNHKYCYITLHWQKQDTFMPNIKLLFYISIENAQANVKIGNFKVSYTTGSKNDNPQLVDISEM